MCLVTPMADSWICDTCICREPSLLHCGHDGAVWADSVAAFLAAGLQRVGDACTILGSTLAIKLLSAVRCDDPVVGAYTQRLGKLWLAGQPASRAGRLRFAASWIRSSATG